MPEQNIPLNPLQPGERLQRLYERLDQMQPPTSADEAFNRLATVLDQVEDEHSGVPKNPNPGLKFDGRMYPPREDFTERTADGHILAATKGNTIEARSDGTLAICSRKTGEPVYHRQGAGQVHTVGTAPELELENRAIAEAFKSIRRARQWLASPSERPVRKTGAPVPHPEPPQHGRDSGPEP